MPTSYLEILPQRKRNFLSEKFILEISLKEISNLFYNLNSNTKGRLTTGVNLC